MMNVENYRERIAALVPFYDEEGGAMQPVSILLMELLLPIGAPHDGLSESWPVFCG